MSASTEKKNRIAAREAGTDKKAIAAKEAADKKTKERKQLMWACIGIVIAIVVILLLNSKGLYTNTTALVADGKNYSPAEMNIYYGQQYNSYANMYQSYGLDTSYLSNMRDTFVDGALESLKQQTALEKYAADNGIELTEEEITAVDDDIAALEENIKEAGYASLNKYFATAYGKGNNKDTIREYSLKNTLASKVYNQVSEELEATVTDEEVAEQYPSVNVRHILVKAEAAEDGTFTDEAKEAAKAKAEAILKEWEEGDATEESFAALAEEKSEDEGSNTNGGLYENVLEGQMVAEFNDFCFDEARKAGDTGIVYGENGAYAGYHVMYFVGEGDPAENETGRGYITSEKMNEWLEELAGGVEATQKFFFRLVGKMG